MKITSYSFTPALRTHDAFRHGFQGLSSLDGDFTARSENVQEYLLVFRNQCLQQICSLF